MDSREEPRACIEQVATGCFASRPWAIIARVDVARVCVENVAGRLPKQVFGIPQHGVVSGPFGLPRAPARARVCFLRCSREWHAARRLRAVAADLGLPRVSSRTCARRGRTRLAAPGGAPWCECVWARRRRRRPLSAASGQPPVCRPRCVSRGPGAPALAQLAGPDLGKPRPSTGRQPRWGRAALRPCEVERRPAGSCARRHPRLRVAGSVRTRRPPDDPGWVSKVHDLARFDSWSPR